MGGEGCSNPSKETREKLSKAFKGKPSPKSQYIKSENYKPATLGKKLSEKERNKLRLLTSGENNPRAILN